MLVTITV